MCGIAGIINRKGKNINSNDIQTMNDMMIHRGPDAEGIYIDGIVGLGHRRLSILDLSENGNQPMVSYDKKYVLVFNGEIYNYIELREQLKKKGAQFQTETDTEVIIEAYRFWGERCVTRFNGMWSIVLYDIDKRQIFFSRDRFGIKPLYVYESEDEFIFASEIKCITAIKPEQKRVDIVQVARYLAGYQEDADEHTFYENIRNFPKSNSMIYNLDTHTKTYQKYWDINVPKLKEKWKCNNKYEEFRRLLEDSIRIRLRADVKTGASLSGGLDSSTIVGIIARKFHIRVHTFSSIYENKSCNEEEYIDCMNQFADTIPHYIYPDYSQDILRDMQDMIYYHDGPCYSASPYSGYCVYRGVGKYVKVLLDGQGADELFGGYLFLFNAKLKELLRKKTWIAKLKAIVIVFLFKKEFPELMSSLSDKLLQQILGPIGYMWVQSGSEKKESCLQQNTKVKFQKEFSRIDLKMKQPGNDSIINELDKELNMQLQYKMLPRILHDVDRNSMARSLEVRLPFLDYRLVEFSYTLSDEDKIHGSWTKYIMRKTCKRYLPDKICNRRNKMGFPAPFGEWIRDGRLKLEIKAYLDAFKKRNIVDANFLEHIYQDHVLGKKNCEDQIFRFMALEMWFQNEIDTVQDKWAFMDKKGE